MLIQSLILKVCHSHVLIVCLSSHLISNFSLTETHLCSNKCSGNESAVHIPFGTAWRFIDSWSYRFHPPVSLLLEFSAVTVTFLRKGYKNPNAKKMLPHFCGSWLLLECCILLQRLQKAFQ